MTLSCHPEEVETTVTSSMESLRVSVRDSEESMDVEAPPTAPCTGVLPKEMRDFSAAAAWACGVGVMGVIPCTPGGTPTRLPTACVSFLRADGGALEAILKDLGSGLGVEAATGASKSDEEEWESMILTADSDWLEESLLV